MDKEKFAALPKKPYICHTDKQLSNMMPKSPSSTIPYAYAACQHTDCPMSGNCLRQVAYKELISTSDRFCIVNPSQCSKDASCRHYRSSAPVRYARGFKGMQKRMYPEQYATFMQILVGRFSRTTFFERRRGERPMPPEEQAIVQDALRMAGVTASMDFDAYEEAIDWSD